MHLFTDFAPDILLLIRSTPPDAPYADPLLAACRQAYPGLPAFELDGQSDTVSWHYAHTLLDKGDTNVWMLVVWEGDDWQPLAGAFRKLSKQPQRFRLWVVATLPLPLQRSVASMGDRAQQWPNEHAMLTALG